MDSVEIAERIAILESRNRTTRMLLVIVFVALIAEIAWTATRGGNIARGTVECQHMVVTDDLGRRRLELGMQTVYGNDWVPAIRLFDEAGMSRVELSIANGMEGPAARSCPTVGLRYAGGVEAARLSVSEWSDSSSAHLGLWGKDDAHASLSADGRGECSLTLMPGREGGAQPRCELWVGSCFGSLSFSSPASEFLASLDAPWQKSPRILLQNVKGETIWESP